MRVLVVEHTHIHVDFVVLTVATLTHFVVTSLTKVFYAAAITASIAGCRKRRHHANGMVNSWLRDSYLINVGQRKELRDAMPYWCRSVARRLLWIAWHSTVAIVSPIINHSAMLPRPVSPLVAQRLIHSLRVVYPSRWLKHPFCHPLACTRVRLLQRC